MTKPRTDAELTELWRPHPELRFLSVCSGIEAASVALNPLGFKAVGFAEIDKAASKVLAHHYPGVPNYGDFTTIDRSKLGRVDLLCGGTPCQSFSIAGKRLSLADARGNLTLAFAVLAHELVRTNGLRNVFWENVPDCLNTADNAFGCFLAALVGSDHAVLPSPMPAGKRGNINWRWLEDEQRLAPRWPRAGLVAGPRGRAAWVIKNAEFFGLAQRRERVFLVADFGNGADPAEVLFERKSGDWNPERGRKERERIASAAQAGAGIGFGGGNRSGPIDASACLTAKGQRIDFEVETFIAEGVAPTLSARNKGGGGLGTDFDCDGGLIAHALRGEGFDASEDGSGRGTPLIPVAFAIQERAVSENPNAGPQGMGIQEGVAYTLDARHHVQAVSYRTSGNHGAWETGDTTDALTTSTDPNSHVLAFSCKDHGADATNNLAPTLRSMGHDASHANAGGQLAVAFDLRGREGGAQFEGPHDTANIRAASGGSSRSYVVQQWVVRRLTPEECERLQGFPDGYTSSYGQADGPRYKQLGNSWAVPCISWIGERLASAMREIAA